MHLDAPIIEDIDIENVDICLYVKNKCLDMEMIRDKLMTYIGGQSDIQCNKHRLPFIVNKDDNHQCYQCVEGENGICRRKISLRCPDLWCKIGLCKKCVNKLSLPGKHFISPPDDTLEYDICSECRSDSDSTVDGQTLSVCSDDIYSSSVDSILQFLNTDTQGSDDINDFVIFGGNDDIPKEEVVPEYFPTSLSGNTPFLVKEDTTISLCHWSCDYESMWISFKQE